MIILTSDCRQLVPMGESLAILNLISHRKTGDHGTSLPDRNMRSERPLPQGTHLDATTLPQPTPAHCYGCVDWFHY